MNVREEMERLRASDSGSDKLRAAVINRMRSVGAPHLSILAREVGCAIHVLEEFAESGKKPAEILLSGAAKQVGGDGVDYDPSIDKLGVQEVAPIPMGSAIGGVVCRPNYPDTPVGRARRELTRLIAEEKAASAAASAAA